MMGKPIAAYLSRHTPTVDQVRDLHAYLVVQVNPPERLALDTLWSTTLNVCKRTPRLMILAIPHTWIPLVVKRLEKIDPTIICLQAVTIKVDGTGDHDWRWVGWDRVIYGHPRMTYQPWKASEHV